MNWIFNDGGRETAGYKGTTNDCVVRAIAIATEKPYQEVYELVNHFSKKEKRSNKSSARTGVHKATTRKVMEHLGAEWIPTMTIGSGCKVHLRKSELPSGKIIVNLSRHLSAVIDGVIQDIYDSSRGGTRCVYGYWIVK
jgi:hypothetical protein